MSRLLASSPRYLAVSALCMALNAALLIELDRLGVHYAVSVLVSAAALIPSSYALHVFWTYRMTGRETRFRRYFATQIVNTPIALLLLFVIHDRLGIAMIWAAPVVIFLMFLYNFLSSFWAIALVKPRIYG